MHTFSVKHFDGWPDKADEDAYEDVGPDAVDEPDELSARLAEFQSLRDEGSSGHVPSAAIVIDDSQLAADGETLPSREEASSGNGGETMVGPSSTSGGETMPSGPSSSSGGETMPARPSFSSGGEIMPSEPSSSSGGETMPSGPSFSSGGEIMPSGRSSSSGGETMPSGPSSTSGGEEGNRVTSHVLTPSCILLRLEPWYL